MPKKPRLTPELSFLRLITDPDRNVRGNYQKPTRALLGAVGLDNLNTKEMTRLSWLFKLDIFDKTANALQAALLKAIHMFGILTYLTEPALTHRAQELDAVCHRTAKDICNYLFKRHYAPTHTPTDIFVQFITDNVSASLLEAARSDKYEKIMQATFAVQTWGVNCLRPITGAEEGSLYQRFKDQSIEYKHLTGGEQELFVERAPYLLAFVAAHGNTTTREQLNADFNRLYASTVLNAAPMKTTLYGFVNIGIFLACATSIYKAATLGGEFNIWTTVVCTPFILYLTFSLVRSFFKWLERQATDAERKEMAAERILIENEQQLLCYEYELPDATPGFIFSQPSQERTPYVSPTETITTRATGRKTTAAKRREAQSTLHGGGGGDKGAETDSNPAERPPKNHHRVINRDGILVALALFNVTQTNPLSKGNIDAVKLVELLRSNRYQIVPTTDTQNQAHGSHKIKAYGRAPARFVGSYSGKRILDGKSVRVFKITAARPAHL